MRIIFAGTPDIAAAVLQALINANYEIVACLTQPDRPQGRGLHLTPSPVKNLAQQHNIPVLHPVSLKNVEAQQQLQALNADLMIVLAYGLILPAAVLTIPKLGCINIHASILPRWRGAAPIQHAILSGDKQTGITIMQMDVGLDTGDILSIYPCTIKDTYTSGDLLQELTALAQTAILDSLIKLSNGQLIPTKQDNALATYADKINKADAFINWHDSATSIDRLIRAYNPWPVAFTRLGDTTIRIWNAAVATSQNIHNKSPGKIIAVNNGGIFVATGDGVIQITKLQFPGKKQLPAADIWHAHPEICIDNAFSLDNI